MIVIPKQTMIPRAELPISFLMRTSGVPKCQHVLHITGAYQGLLQVVQLEPLPRIWTFGGHSISYKTQVPTCPAYAPAWARSRTP
jgi:hypothetical protein